LAERGRKQFVSELKKFVLLVNKAQKIKSASGIIKK
jgi:hypothetical protein